MMASARPSCLPIDISDDVSNCQQGSPRSALAFDIELEGQNSPIPKGLEKRLAERSEVMRAWSNEEIDQKLILAEKRRKEFLDWLSNKAKPKQKGPNPMPFSSEELAAKLEARLSAAEAKRTELLARDKDRLAAYFASHEERLARRQGSAERRWDATWQRLVKAEQRRAALLEAEKGKAAERYSQAREIARSVLEARDEGARALQEKLEEKLVRASSRRQQLQQERGSLGKRRASHGDKLSRKLAKHWKAFVRQNKTTAQLAEEFQACNVSQETATKLPFERFAGSITSAKTMKAAKDLLARLETRLLLLDGKQKDTAVEHLLRRLSEASHPRRSPSPSPASSPRGRSPRTSVGAYSPGVNTPHGGNSPGVPKLGRVHSHANSGPLRAGPTVPSPGVHTPPSGNSQGGVNAPSERYPARVFLCAFMILGHQEAVFNKRGPREAALTDASKHLIPLFEELLTTIAERNFDSGGSSPRDSYGDPVLPSTPQRKRFADQLRDFDSAWLRYLDQFVAWKVKDLSSLEGDLIKVALHLETSMHQYCKVLHGESAPHLTPDQEAIRVQVASDQTLLRERIDRLTGGEGLARMEAALETLRASFVRQRNEARVGNPLDVPMEIAQLDEFGNRVDGEKPRHDFSSGVSRHVSTDVSGLEAGGAPVVGGLSVAFGGKGGTGSRGQVSRSEETSLAQSGSPFGFKFPKAQKPTPLEVPHNKAAAEGMPGSSRGSGKSPVARQLFAQGKVENSGDGYVPLFTLGKTKSPAHTQSTPVPPVGNERLPHVTEVQPKNLENIHMVHELLYDPNWNLSSGGVNQPHSVNEPPPFAEPDPDDPGFRTLSDAQKQLGVAMERAFWDSVKEGLAADPPNWGRVVGLVLEVRGELEGLVPKKWREELMERMDTELLQQVLEKNTRVDFSHLLSLLHYAADLMIRLGAPARDQEAKASLQTLLTELSSSTNPPETITRGLKYLFERLAVLKRDVSNARLKALAPILQGGAGVEYERKWFVERYPRLVEDPHLALPKTATWLADVSADLSTVRMEHEAAVEAAVAAGLPSPVAAPLPAMRTGLSRTSIGKQGPAVTATVNVPSKPLDWDSPSTLVKLGLLRFTSLTQGVTEDSLPETLQLDVGKVREAQDRYQRVLVGITGLLLTRQVSASKGLGSGPKLEGLIATAYKRLTNLLDNPSATLSMIGKLLVEVVSEAVSSKEWADVGEGQMTSLLEKATKADDVIFVLVGKVLVSALRGAVFGGTTPLGKALASNALRRAGASLLVDDVLSLAGKISKTADVNNRVHGPWYSKLMVDEL